MDLNLEYASHQQALMSADHADNAADRRVHLLRADTVAQRIGAFQQGLGAAAACAWCATQLATPSGA